MPLVFSNLNGSRDEIGDSSRLFEPFWAGCAAVQNTVGGNESMALRGVGFGRLPWWRRTPKTPSDKDKRGLRVMWQSSAIFEHVLAFGRRNRLPHLPSSHEVQTRHTFSTKMCKLVG